MKWCLIWVYTVKGLLGGKEGRSGESTRLPPMWPGFKSRRRHHMWVEFVVGSLPCSVRFFLPVLRFSPLLKKTNISKFQFDQESGRRRPTLWMCYLHIVFYFVICFHIVSLFFFINKVFVIDICMHIRVLA